MNYVNPKMVRSPKTRISRLNVLEDNGESSWSLAEVVWDGAKCLGVRWNGSLDDANHHLGTPQSRGIPMWFILPGDDKFFNTLEEFRKHI